MTMLNASDSSRVAVKVPAKNGSVVAKKSKVADSLECSNSSDSDVNAVVKSVNGEVAAKKAPAKEASDGDSSNEEVVVKVPAKNGSVVAKKSKVADSLECSNSSDSDVNAVIKSVNGIVAAKKAPAKEASDGDSSNEEVAVKVPANGSVVAQKSKVADSLECSNSSDSDVNAVVESVNGKVAAKKAPAIEASDGDSSNEEEEKKVVSQPKKVQEKAAESSDSSSDDDSSSDEDAYFRLVLGATIEPPTAFGGHFGRTFCTSSSSNFGSEGFTELFQKNFRRAILSEQVIEEGDCSLDELVISHVDGSPIKDSNVAQLAVVFRSLDGKVLLAQYCVLDLNKLLDLPNCKGFRFAKDGEPNGPELGAIGYSILLAIEKKVNACHLFTDSMSAFNMLCRTNENKFKTDTHQFLAISTRELWLSSGVFLSMKQLPREQNWVADMLSKMNRGNNYSDYIKQVKKERKSFRTRIGKELMSGMLSVKRGRRYYKLLHEVKNVILEVLKNANLKDRK